MNKGLALTKGAAADLREIFRHTTAQWGKAQAVRYIAQLERAAAALARAEGIYKSGTALYPQLRVARCQRHYIFCLPRPNAPPLIVAIFHERMNMIARLQSRLN